MRRTIAAALLGAALLPAMALAGTPKASSELKDNAGNKYPASQAFDGLLNTGWAEGDMGAGAGSWIELALDGPVQVESISIWPGNMSLGQRTLREYGRPRDVKITLSGGGEDVSVDARLLDPGERGPLRTDVEISGKATKVRIDVVDAIPGGVYNDLFIAEVAVNFVKGEAPKTVDRLVAWADSDAGTKAKDKDREEVIALYDRVVAGGDVGDREALLELMDRAGDGAPYLRKQVVALAPAGFRVLALPPDEVAIEALLKLKDSNAIPAIERAALRSRGSDARKLLGQVDIFKAYGDLVGGGRFNIPPWGTTGWEKGALQGRGEPLPIEVDDFGSLWVADVGNNRVERFTVDGIFEKFWGAQEPGIASSWFTNTRVTPYVAGANPGVEKGEFTTPVDLAKIPGKDGDSIAALDAKGRVTVIDQNGVVTRVFAAPVEDEIVPAVGGEGHIVYLSKGNKLAIVWGNEGWTYSVEGEELGHFELEDGSPTGAVALKNGKLGLIYGKQLVMYSLDGFRFGDLMRGALGEGFESWDITMDNNGKPWALTDKGVLYKMKKPGRVDFSVKVTDYSLDVPRLAVIDDLAFFTHDDEIHRVDALEEKAKQDLAAAEAAAAGK